MGTSLPLIDSVLDIDPASQFVYFDTGEPSTDKAYTTWICVHGMVHNHRTWRDMAATAPPNTRVLAYSLRGYKGCSPFTEDVSDHSKVQERVGDDFASVITAFISRFSLLSHPDSRVKVICWSLGNISAISAYRLLFNGLLSDDKARALSQQISEIVLYEPPAGLLGFEPSETTKEGQRTRGNTTMSPEQQEKNLLDHLLGIWDYPESFTAGGETRSVNHRPDIDTVFTRTETLNDNPDMQKRAVDGVVDMSSLQYCIASGIFNNTPEGKQVVRDGLRAMLEAPALKSIRPLTSKNTIPDCVEGSFLVGAILRELEADVRSGTEIKVVVLEGRYSHYLQNQAPELLWAKITQ